MPIKPEVSTPPSPALATPIICPACLKLTALHISNKRNCECHFITGFYSAPSLRVHESWSRHQNFALFPAWTSVHCLSSSEQFGWCTIHIKLRAVVNYNKLVVLFNHSQKSHLRTCIVSRQDPWCLLMGGGGGSSFPLFLSTLFHPSLLPVSIGLPFLAIPYK